MAYKNKRKQHAHVRELHRQPDYQYHKKLIETKTPREAPKPGVWDRIKKLIN